MTLDQAVLRVRAIQADLEAGRLTVPYPDAVNAELAQLGDVLADHCKTKQQAEDLVARIQAPARQAALPW